MKSDLNNTLFKNILKPILMGGGGEILRFIAAPFSHEYTHAVRLLNICGLRIVTCIVVSVARLHLLSPFHYFPMEKRESIPLFVNNPLVFHLGILSFFSSENIDAFCILMS